jgi:hypothetical protein
LREISLTYLDRNFEIVKERMIDQMEQSFTLGRKLIDTELDTGMLNFVVKPLVKTFYDYWSQHDARSGTLKQIQVTLNAGKEIILRGDSGDKFQEIFNNTFPEYIKADQTYRQCSKRHKNYERLKEVAKNTYLNYLKEVVLLLKVEENVNDYGDLCTHAFNTKEEAKRILLNQLEYTDEAIRIVEEDPSILNIPFGRKIILKTLRKGFEVSKKDLLFAINDTY